MPHKPTVPSTMLANVAQSKEQASAEAGKGNLRELKCGCKSLDSFAQGKCLGGWWSHFAQQSRVRSCVIKLEWCRNSAGGRRRLQHQTVKVKRSKWWGEKEATVSFRWSMNSRWQVFS